MDAAAHVDATLQPAQATGHDTAPPGRTLLAVTAVGVIVAALTWRIEDAGMGWFATDLVLVAAIFAGVARGRPGGAGWLLGAASVWLAGATCWYASDWALATAFPASLATLCALALVAARRTPIARVIDVGRTSIEALRAIPSGIVDAARLPGHAVGAGARAHLGMILRGLLLGVPVALVFAALLAADGQFRAAIGRMLDRSGEGVDIFLWTLGTTVVLLVAFAVLRQLSRAADGPRGVIAPWPYRVTGDAPLVVAARVGPRVRPLTWSVVLTQVVAVFGVYVGANAGSLFAGHEHLRARGTLTYASYVHEGFAQVSFATFLAVACVVAGHLLLRPRGGQVRIAGGKGLVLVELVLLALVAVTLASCAHRLSLYEQAYGYTYLRLGVWLLQLAVAGLVAMTTARCLARGWRGWGAALAWSGVAFAMLAGSLDADGWIARGNVARASAGSPLDVEYLSTLSADARGVLPSVAAIDRNAAWDLARAWSPHHAVGWRARRGIGSP